MGWTERDIPDQAGRVALVTGANSGLGLATTRALAAAGATVIMACRDPGRAAAARDRVTRQVPGADLRLAELDLAALASVAALARGIDGPLDLLVCNAGVMGGERGTTTDGFETQMGVNHLGHFALVGRLLPRMLDVPGSRVVTVSSVAARRNTLVVDDLDTTRDPAWMTAYAASKQANAVHAIELERRLRRGGHRTIALSAHPGLSATSLADHLFPDLLRPVVLAVGGLVFNTPRQGARPQLRAATDPDARGGQYWGPAQLDGLRGPAAEVPLPRRADDPDLGRDLWDASVALTGVDPGI